MQTQSAPRLPRREGNALLLVIALTGAALLLASGLFDQASTVTKLNYRHIEHQRAVAAAEAATEKVVSQVVSDFRNLGEGYVLGRQSSYRNMVPTVSEHPAGGEFLFRNLAGDDDRLEVTFLPGSSYAVSSGRFAGLHGNRSQLRVVANARARYASTSPVGSVYQDIELLRIPIFQFAIFYNLIMEIDNGPNTFTVTGPVHCNTNVYLDPYNTLTFNSDLTASGTIAESKLPGHPLSGSGSGAIVYNAAHVSRVSTLNLPIGTNNSIAAVRAIIEVPPAVEDPYSSIGQQRYYNKADLIILVRDTNIVATSGLRSFFAIQIPGHQIANFVATNVTFYNKREQKTIKSTDIDIKKLIKWNETNTHLRPWLLGGDIRTIFVADQRTQTSATQPGIRLINGETMLPQGLTVATPNPLYTLGHYNAPHSHRGSTNTSATLPASLIADAVSVLSSAWKDVDSSKSLSYRKAGPTTVNAAILTGQVPSTSASYSGGVQNFPRLLEDWNSETLTYNGSMVAMFYSKVATNLWRGIGSTYDIYNPPTRNWAMDQNFLQESKLPPATPNMTILVRGRWRMPAPYSTNVLAGF